MGLPEGGLALAQAAVYLAIAPKSNALYTAYGAVQRDVEETAADPVPLHLRNAPTRLMKELGYGKDISTRTTSKTKVTDMECLPENLRDRGVLSHQRRRRKAHSRADGRGETPAIAHR